MPSASKVASQAIFQHTLPDVLRTLRSLPTSASEEEAVVKILSDVKAELLSPLTNVKVVAIQKAMYFTMLGYHLDYAFFPMVEAMSDRRYSYKRTAYLAASLCLSQTADVIPLTTGLLIRDLQSPNSSDQALALSFLSSICTPDLARDVVGHVVGLLDTRFSASIRKRATGCLYKLFLEYPEALRPVFIQLKEKVDDSSPKRDPDANVRSAVVCVLCELARRLPETYIGLAIPFYGMLSNIEGNWALIKIIKVFSYFVPYEPRLVKKLAGPLEELLAHTKAASVKYECYHTIMTTDLGKVPRLAELAVEGVESFLKETDQNLRFMGLASIGRHPSSHAAVLRPLTKVIRGCLGDEDTTIRRRAGLLLRDITTEKDLMSTAMDMLAHSVTNPPDTEWSNEVVLRIVELVQRDGYAHLKDVEWYVSVLLDLFRLPIDFFKHGEFLKQELMRIVLSVGTSGSFAVEALAQVLLDDPALLPPPPGVLSRDEGDKQHTGWHVLSAAAFACGEYTGHLSISKRLGVCSVLLGPAIRGYPAELQCTSLYAVGKLLTSVRREDAAAWESWEGGSTEGGSQRERCFQPFLSSVHSSVAEAARFVDELLQCDATGEVSTYLFSDPLLPVAAEAQEHCSAPDGVDLAELLCPFLPSLLPLSDSEESESEGEDVGPMDMDFVAPRPLQEEYAEYYLGEDSDAEEDNPNDPRERRPPRQPKKREERVDPAGRTRDLLAQKRRLVAMPQFKGSLTAPVWGGPGDEEEAADEVTRRLRHVDVRRGLTAADALPCTTHSYATLLEMAAQEKQRLPCSGSVGAAPLLSWSSEWLRVDVHRGGDPVSDTGSRRVLGLATVDRKTGVLQLSYRLSVEHSEERGIFGEEVGPLTDLRLAVDMSRLEKGGELSSLWEGIEIVHATTKSASKPSSGGLSKELVLATRLKPGASLSIDFHLSIHPLPTASRAMLELLKGGLPLVLHCLRHRQGQPISLGCLHIAASDFAPAGGGKPSKKKYSSRSIPVLSLDELTAEIARQSTDASCIDSEVRHQAVGCSQNDLLLTIPRLQTDLGLFPGHRFEKAMSLYTGVYFPSFSVPEQPLDAEEGREAASLRFNLSYVLVLLRANIVEQDEKPKRKEKKEKNRSKRSDVLIEVSVRSVAAPFTEQFLESILEVLESKV